MNIDGRILDKILANSIKKTIKKIYLQYLLGKKVLV